MGSQNSTNKSVITQYDASQWKKVQQNLLNNNNVINNSHHVIKNIKTNEYGQIQLISLDPKYNIQKQLQIYQYRKDHSQHIVKCLYVNMKQNINININKKNKNNNKLTNNNNNNQNNKSLFCGSNGKLIQIITQHIPFRLSTIPNYSLSYRQCIYIICESLSGYKQCYNKLGVFDITQQMIGINQQGKIKVWVNQSFSKNHPNIQKPILQITAQKKQYNQYEELFNTNKDQNDMIKTIIKIVQPKCNHNQIQQFNHIKQYLYSNKNTNNKSLTFDNTYKQIQSYCTNKNIILPDRLLKYIRNNHNHNHNTHVINNNNTHVININKVQPINHNNIQTVKYNNSNIYRPSKVVFNHQNNMNTINSNMNMNTINNSNMNNINNSNNINPVNRISSNVVNNKIMNSTANFNNAIPYSQYTNINPIINSNNNTNYHQYRPTQVVTSINNNNRIVKFNFKSPQKR